MELSVHSSSTIRSHFWIKFPQFGLYTGMMVHGRTYEEEVSFIPYRKDFFDQALRTFIFLRKSSEDFLVNAYEIVEHSSDVVSIMGERMIPAGEFFKPMFDILGHRYGDVEPGPLFMKFFRNVMQGFVVLTKKEISIGDFGKNVFITQREKEGRILPNLFLEWDLKRELISFRNFLVHLVGYQNLKDAPPFIRFYVEQLEVEISLVSTISPSSMFVQLVADCPNFWSSSERVLFINNLYLLVKTNRWLKSHFRQIHQKGDEYSWIFSWHQRIKDSVFILVFNYPTEAKLAAQAKLRQKFASQAELSDNSAFSHMQSDKETHEETLIPGTYYENGYDLMRYVVALYHHYNDHISGEHEFLKPTEIEEKIYCIFPEIYYTFAHAFRVFARRTSIPISDKSWNMLLSVGEREFKLSGVL